MSIIANVTVLGQEFSWGYPPNYSVPQATLAAALAANGFDPKKARQLPERFTFVRALRLWLCEQTGGRVDHTISDVIDSLVVDDLFDLKIQIDNKVIDTAAKAVRWQFSVAITLNKASGKVYATDPAVEKAIRDLIPRCQADRKATDVTNMVHRLMKKNVGPLGLIPWNGRGTYFVLDAYRSTLDRLCSFLAAIGASFSRIDCYHVVPTATPNQSPSPTPAPNGQAPQSQPTGNQAVVDKALSDKIGDLIRQYENDLYELNTTQWKNAKAKERKENELYESVNAALHEIWQYNEILGTHVARLRDHAEYVKALLARRGQREFIPVLETVTYIPDPTDDISVIQVISTPADLAEVRHPATASDLSAEFGAPGNDNDRACNPDSDLPKLPAELLIKGKIHWNMTPIAA